MRSRKHLTEQTEALLNELIEENPEFQEEMPQIFREFLLAWQATGGKIENLAIIDDSVATSPSRPGQPFRFDHWIETPQTATTVLLMGTTLRGALVRCEDVWKKFLQRNGHLQVLLQGGLEHPDSLITRASAHLRQRSQAVLIARRSETIALLKQLRDTVDVEEQGALEVRQTDDLLTYSAAVLWRIDGHADAQIHPYGPLHDYYKNPRFIVTGSEDSRAFAAVVTPIEHIWDGAQTVSFRS